MCHQQGNQAQHRPSLVLHQMTTIKDLHQAQLPHPERHLRDRPNVSISIITYNISLVNFASVQVHNDRY